MSMQEDRGSLKLLALSRKETVDLIGMLVAQLGDTHLDGQQAGAAPMFVVRDPNGHALYRLGVVVADSMPEPKEQPSSFPQRMADAPLLNRARANWLNYDNGAIADKSQWFVDGYVIGAKDERELCRDAAGRPKDTGVAYIPWRGSTSDFVTDLLANVPLKLAGEIQVELVHRLDRAYSKPG